MSNTIKLLPDDNYKYNISRNINFNNQLLSGINSGLSLYDKETDTQLYRPSDTKPLDRVSFDDINKKLENNYSKNDDLYNNAKSSVAGVITGINKTGDDTINEIKKLFAFDSSGLKTYIGMFLIFLIIYKKI